MYDKYYSKKEPIQSKTEARKYTRDLEYDARNDFKRIDQEYARDITDSRGVELSPPKSKGIKWPLRKSQKKDRELKYEIVEEIEKRL
jgi:hypothetical protein